MNALTRTTGAYTICDDPARLDLNAMHAFTPLAHGERHMERCVPGIYRRRPAG
jgi:hypothetical protein